MDELLESIINLLQFNTQMLYHGLKYKKDTTTETSVRKNMEQQIYRLTLLVKDLQEQRRNYKKGGIQQ